MARDVKVTLAGDAGVGKSSLVTTLVKDSWTENVQKVVPEILLPSEVTDAGVATRIVDTGSTPDRRSHLEASLRSAHVIILVYSISDPTSFDRIPTYWLPYIRSLGINVPVILVGNKIDLRTDGAYSDETLEEELAPIMAEFKEVESCIETSVKEGVNVSEVFYFAQKAVLYPTAPLYDSKTHTLKTACISALERIFKLCDADKDGLLSDDELNDFQRRCFGAPLQQQELEGIKSLVGSAPVVSYGHGRGASGFSTLAAEGRRERTQSNGARSAASSAGSGNYSNHGDASMSMGGSRSNGQSSYHPHLNGDKLTISGWLHLHTLFIQRGRLETTWAVLQSYGYGHDLALSSEYLNPPSFHVPSDCSVELSPYGYSFLTDIFEAHDKDRDGALSAGEMADLFATAPGGKHPWDDGDFPNTTVTDEHGAVTLQGWLAQWSMTTLLDYKVTLANLAYLGYPSFVVGGPKDLASGSATPSHSATTASSQQRPSPPPTTTALKLTRRNTRRLFPSSFSSASSSSTSPSSQGTSSTTKKKKKKGDPAERSVFLAYVVGAAGSGKSSLLQAMVGKRFDARYTPTTRTRSVVSAIEQNGMERYLVLQEFGSRYESDALRSHSKVSQADLILFVWDSSDTNSFSYISNLRQQFPPLVTLPSLFVATKADLDSAQQRHEVQPDVYCLKLGLQRYSPLAVSAAEGRMSDLYTVACAIAQDPRGNAAVPGADGQRWSIWSPFSFLWSGGGGTAGNTSTGGHSGAQINGNSNGNGNGTGRTRAIKNVVVFVGLAGLVGGGAWALWKLRQGQGLIKGSHPSAGSAGGGTGQLGKVGQGASGTGAGSGWSGLGSWRKIEL